MTQRSEGQALWLGFSQLDHEELTVPFGAFGRWLPQSPHELASAGVQNLGHFSRQVKICLSRVVPLLPCHTHPGFSQENVGLLDLSSSGVVAADIICTGGKALANPIHFRAEIHRSTSNCLPVTAHHAVMRAPAGKSARLTVRSVFQRHGAFPVSRDAEACRLGLASPL